MRSQAKNANSRIQNGANGTKNEIKEDGTKKG